jgi:hypothetical protein
MLVKRMIKSRQIILAGIIIIALLSSMGTVVALGDSSITAHGPGTISGTSTPDNSPIGPESPLFGLKVAMEDLDETFTFNDTQRVEKQVDHAQTRIEEVSRELELNQAGYAEKALEMYSQKLNQTEMSLPRFQSDATGLLHVQELIARHQTLLADLLSRYPDRTGLANAYNNNLVLEQKFGEKTRMRFDRVVDKNDKTILKAVKLEPGKQNNAGENNTASAGSTGQGRNETQDHVKDKKEDMVNPTVAPSVPTPANENRSSKDLGKKDAPEGVVRSGEVHTLIFNHLIFLQNT